jgi:hypothetical protein
VGIGRVECMSLRLAWPSVHRSIGKGSDLL